MVGDTKTMLRTTSGNEDNADTIQCTYSRRKKEKRAKFADDVGEEELNAEKRQQFVDKFVQVIWNISRLNLTSKNKYNV